MKKFLLLLLLVSACASAAPASIPAVLRGCWIEHRGADAITMRWFAIEESTSWHGDEVFTRPGAENEHQGFNLNAATNENAPWELCPLDDGFPEGHGPPCQKVFFGKGHASGELTEWMEIHASTNHLRLVSAHMGSPDSALFDGDRDGCD